MLTIEEIFGAYEQGDLTRNDLYGHLLVMLPRAPVEIVWERLRGEPSLLEAFEGWALTVSTGAEVVSGGRPLPLSPSHREALARFQTHARAARYAELARRMDTWASDAHVDEPAVDPEEIEPFVSRAVEPLVGEAA
jgi:hypothetical protein